ncbi:MAG: 23S rRNA (uracil(1939)-C(5))-methyltransferase RlmD, partial [Ignavibacteriaceae bacterium]|nr:23S rRNA (uracil(1939)-C(5))-methyltransferase RlmD [Ignavibacteriaceae bacterium]
MKKGDIIELTIDRYAFEGKGLAKIDKNLIVPSPPSEKDKHNNYVVFADGSYPGDTVKTRLLKIKKSYAESKVVEVVIPSPYRIPAKCRFFGLCGGCKQQDLDYQVQLKFKHQQVEEIFQKMGGFKDFEIQPIVPSEKVFYYRNKMEFSFADKRWLKKEEIENEKITDRNFALGLHIPGIYDKVLDIDECFLQSELSNKILNFTRDFFKTKGTPVYSTKTHEGYLRNLVIKQSHHTDDLMVNLVTASENEELMQEYTAGLLTQVPQITTVINNINLKMAAVATGDYEKVFHGTGYIYDSIGGYVFRISANSFFQTNSLQAEKLYDTALEFAQLKGDEIIYDLYSGAGTITIFISGKAKEVYAFETIDPAIMDAEENASLNNIKNVKFIKADLYKSFLPIVKTEKLPKPDVMIIDPPRSGMHPTTVQDV